MAAIISRPGIAVSALVLWSLASARGDDLGFSKTGMFIHDVAKAGEPARCLVDTGSPATFLDALACRLPALGGSPLVRSRTTSRMHENVLKNVSVSFFENTSEIDVVDVDLSTLRGVCGQKAVAIVGRDLLQSNSVQFEDGRPFLSRDAPLDLDRFDFRYPISESGEPTIPVEVPVFGEHEFVVHTGFNQPLHLSEDLANALLRSRRAVIGSESANVNLTGSDTSRGLIIQEVTVAGVTFRNVPAGKGTINCIGMELLTQMRMCIDFKRKMVYVDSRASQSADAFSVNASGMHLLFTSSSQLYAADVRKSSSAFAAGLRKGDTVLKLNNTAPDQLTRQELDRLLSQDGTSLSVEYERGGNRNETTFVMRRSFDYPPKWEVTDDETSKFIESLDTKQ